MKLETLRRFRQTRVASKKKQKMRRINAKRSADSNRSDVRNS